jgi:heptaprenyl diphosphate synthase
MNVKKLCIISLSVSLSLVLSFLESLVPPLVAIPGVKVGIANTVSLFVLYSLGAAPAFVVSVVRVSLSSLLFGSSVSFLYSLFGACLSLAVMTLFKKLGFFSMIGVSILGGVFHNVGQIVAAILVMKSGAILVYLPPLMISGIIAGVLVGILSGIVLKKLNPYILK